MQAAIAPQPRIDGKVHGSMARCVPPCGQWRSRESEKLPLHTPTSALAPRWPIFCRTEGRMNRVPRSRKTHSTPCSPQNGAKCRLRPSEPRTFDEWFMALRMLVRTSSCHAAPGSEGAREHGHVDLVNIVATAGTAECGDVACCASRGVPCILGE